MKRIQGITEQYEQYKYFENTKTIPAAITDLCKRQAAKLQSVSTSPK